MKKRPVSAFTLIEIITAISIILVLTGLVLSIAGYVSRKGSATRATAEIKMLETGCVSYKAEVGVFPQDFENGDMGDTDKLSPKRDFNPTSDLYREAGEFLYEQLSGDKNRDGIPDEGAVRYLKEYDPRILKTEKDQTTQRITKVDYFQDPYGYAYGYSTAAAYEEQKYQRELKKNGNAERPTNDQMPGFNGSSFDLWSTGGSRPSKVPSTQQEKELEWAKWHKNW